MTYTSTGTASGSAAKWAAEQRAGALKSAAEQHRRWAAARFPACEVDAVIAAAVAAMWRRAADYRPESGTLASWAFGFVRNGVMARRRQLAVLAGRESSIEDPDTADLAETARAGHVAGGEAAMLVRFEVAEWLDLVAEFARPRDWELVIGSLAGDGHAPANVRPREAEAARLRVQQLAATLRGRAGRGHRPVRGHGARRRAVGAGDYRSSTRSAPAHLARLCRTGSPQPEDPSPAPGPKPEHAQPRTVPPPPKETPP